MHRRPSMTTLVVLISTLLLASCGSEASAPDEPERTPEPTPGTWTMISPGGETVCADGSDYAFFAREGTVDRLVVAFMGGGACWDAETCGRPFGSPGESYYVDRVDATAAVLGDPAFAVGLHDAENPANPVADWHQVFVPYCTGDLHLGDAAVDDGPNATVHHRGAANARAALDWAIRTFESPERVFVTGCSAGAYGSIFWTPYLAEAYPDAQLAQLGDSGAGVVPPSFAEEGLGRWNVAASLPHFAPGTSPEDLERVHALEHLYRAVGEAHPRVSLSQYNTRFDGVQAYFYEAMGGDARDWSARMLESLDALEGSVPSFDSYVADYGFEESTGTPHCIITRDDLYTTTTAGTPFLSWLNALLAGRDPGTVRPPAIR